MYLFLFDSLSVGAVVVVVDGSAAEVSSTSRLVGGDAGLVGFVVRAQVRISNQNPFQFRLNHMWWLYGW